MGRLTSLTVCFSEEHEAGLIGGDCSGQGALHDTVLEVELGVCQGVGDCAHTYGHPVGVEDAGSLMNIIQGLLYLVPLHRVQNISRFVLCNLDNKDILLPRQQGDHVDGSLS